MMEERLGTMEQLGTEGGLRARERSVTYCVIPPELADKLHDLLRGHFGREPGVEVIVERRGAERRNGIERRRTERKFPKAKERRQAAQADRRLGERRAAQVPVQAPQLPRRAHRHADEIGFVQRVEPSTLEAEDLDTARVVARIQAGDADAQEGFATLYSRYFDRIYAYLRVILNDPHEAEDATQEIFVLLMESMDSYERRAQPFRAWLFRVARNHAISHLRRQGRLVLTDPAELDRRREAEAGFEEERLEVLDWIADRDLLLFVERLPLPQRQVLLLRYMLDMTDRQIAAVLGRNPDDVRALLSRAIRYLRDRLEAIGRGPEASRTDRAGTQRISKQALVLRERRFSLGR